MDSQSSSRGSHHIIRHSTVSTIFPRYGNVMEILNFRDETIYDKIHRDLKKNGNWMKGLYVET